MPMRNICEVIARIKAEVPAGYTSCIAQLDKLSSDVRYTAPEAMRDCWIKLCWILSEELPDPMNRDAPEWAYKIGRIVRDEE